MVVVVLLLVVGLFVGCWWSGVGGGLVVGCLVWGLVLVVAFCFVPLVVMLLVSGISELSLCILRHNLTF